MLLNILIYFGMDIDKIMNEHIYMSTALVETDM